MRVAGSDPGTSSLDLVVLEDGKVIAERRWTPSELSDASVVVSFLEEQAPLDLVAAPSGYGLPLVRVDELNETDEALTTLVRDDDREHRRATIRLTAVLRTLRASSLHAVVLPGGIHLPTIPPHRKIDRIDMGTPDKVCVAALAIAQTAERLRRDYDQVDLLLVEVGSAFSGVLVVRSGRIVDARCGSFGPVGLASGGAWDGELAYACRPLGKDDIFAGGVGHDPSGSAAERLRESLLQTTAGLAAVHRIERVVLQAHGLDEHPVVEPIASDLGTLGEVVRLDSLPGATLKHAAQGAALVADGLAGGTYSPLVERLRIGEASGSVLEHLQHPAAERLRARLGEG